MPRPKKRPTALPDSVKARAIQGGSPAASRAILMTDPRDTAPESPQRPVRDTAPPAPIVYSPQDAADTEPPAPAALDWYEQAIARVPSSPTEPPQRRGKVAVKMTDQGFELASQDADVMVSYEKPKAIAPTPAALPPAPVPPPAPSTDPHQVEPAPGVFPDLALSMVLWCAGFVCALLLVGIALIGSDRPVIVVPSVQGEVNQ